MNIKQFNIRDLILYECLLDLLYITHFINMKTIFADLSKHFQYEGKLSFESQNRL